jgi:DNA helicase-2/ATP-dependent DNA helicase PcrA
VSFTPTAEQQLIIEAARDTSDNLLVQARAGAAKTTTLTLIADALPKVEILAIAFNKKIADELRDRLPDNADAATLNALGHRAWRSYLNKHPKVDSRKTYFLLREIINELPDPAERDLAYEDFRDLLNACRTAKQEGYMPGKLHPQARPLIGDESFFDMLEFEATDLHRDLINEFMRRNFKQGLQGVIDFDDQIYLPALMSCSFPAPQLTMIDEAQDLSHINHVLLRKIVRNRRLIAVGDECQAIYGFRGASENSMTELRETFSMRELYLTLCFRSDQRIIENARWRAPDMQYRPDAAPGLVEHLSVWTPGEIQQGDAIICRNNAPLFSCAIELLRAGLNPELASGDIIAGLEAVFKKLGKPATPSADALAALDAHIAALSQKRKNKAQLRDMQDCIGLFLRERDTLGEAQAFFQQITQQAGRIKLMTGHKSKGLEFDRVWFLDSHLLAPKGQDRNLKYVIETRARHELRYVKSEDWRPNAEPV